jgi:hypothetical protein
MIVGMKIKKKTKKISDKFIIYLVKHYVSKEQKTIELRYFFQYIFEEIEDNCGDNGVNIVKEIIVSPFIRNIIFSVGSGFFDICDDKNYLWTAEVTVDNLVSDVTLNYNELRCGCGGSCGI